MEIELKFPLKNPNEAIQILNKLAKQKNQYHQKDTYYAPIHRDFILEKPISEWLRIRETKNKNTFNYKKWHNTAEKNAVSCDEYETEISDINNLKNILKNLNFKQLIIVNKHRINWEYKDTIISIDNIEDLGFFIEIEANKKFENIDKIKEYLYQILRELDIKTGPQDFEGYPYLLLKKRDLL